MKKLIMVILMVALAASLILVGCTTTATTTTTAPTTKAPTTTAPVATTVAPTTVAPTTAVPTKTTVVPPTTTVGTQAKVGGVIRLLFNESPTGSIGIPENMKGFSAFYAGPMMESLVRGNADGSFSPSLAESWEWSADNLTLTLHLRKGVKFHDGTDFNADAAKWNFDQRMAAKVSGSENVVSYSVVDPYTFQIVIKKYQNTWFGTIARSSSLGNEISPTNVTKNGAAYADWNPVGTGPFKFKQYKENDFLELTRYDGYWGNKTLLDGVKFIFIADAVTQQISFEAGEGDVLNSVQGAEASDLLKKGYTIDMSPGLGNMLIPSSGVATSPFAKKEVRMAVEYAINKDAIIKSVGLGYWKALTQAAGYMESGYISDIQARAYSIAKAKELLATAGYPNGFNTKITCAIIFNGDALTAIQADLKAVGINAELNIVSVQKWLDNVVNGFDEGLEYEPITTMDDFGVNLGRYWITPLKQQYGSGCWWTTLKRPAGLDDLIQQYLVLPDFAAQKAKAKQITQLMYDDETVIPLWEQTTIVIEQKYVKEANYGKLGWPVFNYTGTWMDK